MYIPVFFIAIFLYITRLMYTYEYRSIVMLESEKPNILRANPGLFLVTRIIITYGSLLLFAYFLNIYLAIIIYILYLLIRKYTLRMIDKEPLRGADDGAEGDAAFVAGLTRKVAGKFLYRPRGGRIQTSTIDDSKIVGTPEATVAMMLYGYCNNMYLNPSMSSHEAITLLLEQRSERSGNISTLNRANNESIFEAIQFYLRQNGDGDLFSTNDYRRFSDNLLDAFPVFIDIDIR